MQGIPSFSANFALDPFVVISEVDNGYGSRSLAKLGNSGWLLAWKYEMD